MFEKAALPVYSYYAHCHIGVSERQDDEQLIVALQQRFGRMEREVHLAVFAAVATMVRPSG